MYYVYILYIGEMMIEQLITDISISTMKILWNLSNERDKVKQNSSRLIFPNKQQPKKINKLRISEQEAKIIFIQEMLTKTNGVYYSVETPTIEKYKFSKNAIGNRSGSLDLCLFQKDYNNKLQRILNVEFKAHNMVNSFSNDFEKLFKESTDGLFFHILESVNNGTLKNLTNKYKVALKTNKTYFKHGNIVFFILASLNPKFILMTSITISSLQDLKSFNIDYDINGSTFNFKNKYNWIQIK